MSDPVESKVENFPHPDFALAEARASTAVSRIYANGFVAGYTAVDVAVVLKVGEQPAAILHMPLATAKDLGAQLLNGVQQIEQVFSTEVLTKAEAEQRLRQSASASVNAGPSS